MAPPIDPPALSRRAIAAYVVTVPLVLGLLLFLPAGSIQWTKGWLFIAVLLAAMLVSAIVLWRVNPVIYRARSRVQPGTKSWDRKLLAVLLPAMIVILPVAALDDGRFHRSQPPEWVVILGYVALLAAIALTAWAQAVNKFFEPGVRIQTERGQHVIDTGPYAIVRHPGYVGAVLLFVGMALSLGSFYALIPAAVASGLLILRTVWEDRTLRNELPGYDAYTQKVRWRLLPGLW